MSAPIPPTPEPLPHADRMTQPRRLALPPGFRPQDVPVIAVDDALPAVPAAAQSIAALRERFARQPVWVPEWVRESEGLEVTPVRAAVLIPIVARDEPTVLLTHRSSQLSTHAGQVAFPGGRVDASDASVVAAALREAHEEVALPPGAVDVLGELPGYVTGTGFEVIPVVGLVQPGVPLVPNPGEVDEIFEVPLAFLLNPANHRHHRYRVGEMQREWLSMPYAPHGREHFIWGVTASILRNLYRFMQAPLGEGPRP